MSLKAFHSGVSVQETSPRGAKAQDTSQGQQSSYRFVSGPAGKMLRLKLCSFKADSCSEIVYQYLTTQDNRGIELNAIVQWLDDHSTTDFENQTIRRALTTSNVFSFSTDDDSKEAKSLGIGRRFKNVQRLWYLTSESEQQTPRLSHVSSRSNIGDGEMDDNAEESDSEIENDDKADQVDDELSKNRDDKDTDASASTLAQVKELSRLMVLAQAALSEPVHRARSPHPQTVSQARSTAWPPARLPQEGIGYDTRRHYAWNTMTGSCCR